MMGRVGAMELPDFGLHSTLLSYAQVLFVPDASFPSSTLRLSSSTSGATVSPSSSDAEYDKLPVCILAPYTLRFISITILSISDGNQYTVFLMIAPENSPKGVRTEMLPSVERMHPLLAQLFTEGLKEKGACLMQRYDANSQLSE